MGPMHTPQFGTILRDQAQRDLERRCDYWRSQGVIVTITLAPTFPLRMGGYWQKVEVRKVRK